MVPKNRSPLFRWLRPLWQIFKKLLPETLATRLLDSRLGRILRGEVTKSEAHFDTWKRKYDRQGGALRMAESYKKLMMDAGGIEDERFFDGKIVIDIGCGPGDSLGWIEHAKARIGLDPLADEFMQLGIAAHNMIYLNAGVEEIPLPSNYVDVVFSINALDHVDDPLEAMQEMRRILKPGGDIVLSTNLDGEPTVTEPHTITYSMVEKNLFHGWIKQHEAICPEGQSVGDFYRFFYEDPPADYKPRHMILWARYQKPKAA